MPKPSSPTWSACRAVVKSWPRPGIIALVQELYRLNPDNRDFLHARLLHQQQAASLDSVQRKIAALLTPSAVFNDRFQHARVKRLIDQYEKATANPAAVADLLLHDMEKSCETFNDVGDFEPLVDHIYKSMDRFEKCVAAMPPDQRPERIDRLGSLADRWSGAFGYGLSDELAGLAASLRRDHSSNLGRDNA